MLQKATITLGLDFVDHIIIGKNEFTSIKTVMNWKSKFGKEDDI